MNGEIIQRASTFGVVWVQPWCGPVVWVGVLRARCSTPCKASTLLADVPHLGDRQGEMSRPSEQPKEPQLLTLPEHLVENILAKAYPLGAAPDSDRFSPLGLLSLAAVDRILRAQACSLARWQADQACASPVVDHGLRWQIPRLESLPPFLRLFAVEYFARNAREEHLDEEDDPELPRYVNGFATAPVLFALLQRSGVYRSYCVFDKRREIYLEHDCLWLQRAAAGDVEQPEAKRLGTLVLFTTSPIDGSFPHPPGGPQPSPVHMHVTLDELDSDRLRVEALVQGWPEVDVRLLIPNVAIRCSLDGSDDYDDSDDSDDGPPTFRTAPGDIWLEGGPNAASWLLKFLPDNEDTDEAEEEAEDDEEEANVELPSGPYEEE